jgi:hypothetical protein
LECKKSTISEIKLRGLPENGISRDNDEIWLLLRPTINLTLSSSSAAWIPAQLTSPVQYVTVGMLKGHQTIPAGTLAEFARAGITAADYGAILENHKFSDSGPVDTQRFVAIDPPFPYEPPPQGGTGPEITFALSESSTKTASSEADVSYKVGMTLTGSASFMDAATTKFKNTASWEWTSKSSRSTSTGTSQSASLTIVPPAAPYTGPTVMQAYYDKIYKTFAFRLVPVAELETAVTGTLKTSSGSPMPWKEITLIENGNKRSTFTNGNGEFRFFGHISGPVRLETEGAAPTMVPQLETMSRDVELVSNT